jgi:hypothetical protein
MKIEELHNVRFLTGEKKKRTWFLAETSSGETVFLKKYWESVCSAEKLGNARREILSYDNLLLPFIPKCCGGSVKEGYIILEYVDNFIDLVPTKRDIEETVDIVCNVFKRINPSFLPNRHRTPMREKIKVLKAEGLLGSEKIIDLYFELENKIASFFCFCHGDYMLQNIKRRENGNIAMFDFELADKGHFLNDPATLYIDLLYVPEMQKYLIEYLSQKDGFNRDIFDVLVWKRALGQVYALRNEKKLPDRSKPEK